MNREHMLVLQIRQRLKLEAATGMRASRDEHKATTLARQRLGLKGNPESLLEQVEALWENILATRKYDGAGLYNCCRNGQPPKWTDFDGFEIWPCQIQTAYDGGPVSGGETLIEPLHIPQDAHLVDFWSVYGHLHNGGLECITDTSTRKQAESVVDHFIKEHGTEIQVAMALRESKDAPKH